MSKEGRELLLAGWDEDTLTKWIVKGWRVKDDYKKRFTPNSGWVPPGVVPWPFVCERREKIGQILIGKGRDSCTLR